MEETNEKTLKRLDAYREIEINNLWQRSVFLGTFLVLGYTGYGFLVDKMIPVTNNDELPLLHFLACALACINMIFSVLWIAMAKGSKAWYEAYENAIAFVENAEKELNWKEVRSKINTIRYKFYNIERTDEKHKRLHPDDKKDDCLFTTEAGGYSPARINIALGQISFFIWLIVLMPHIVMLCQMGENTILKVFSFLIIWGMVIVMCHLENNQKWIKSGYFKD